MVHHADHATKYDEVPNGLAEKTQRSNGPCVAVELVERLLLAVVDRGRCLGGYVALSRAAEYAV